MIILGWVNQSLELRGRFRVVQAILELSILFPESVSIVGSGVETERGWRNIFFKVQNYQTSLLNLGQEESFKCSSFKASKAGSHFSTKIDGLKKCNIFEGFYLIYAR